ncbi:MAG TPA: MASE1 domain-containing protein, partial [Caulobacteraceae bacterium]
MHRELASLAPLLTGTLVCALVMLAIGFSRAGGTVAALWGAAGLGAAMWLRAKPTLSFDAAFGATLAAAFGIGNLMSGNSVAMSAMFTIVDTAEVALAVWLMRRFAPRFDIATVKGLSTFWLLACVCGAGGGMALAALGLQLLGRGEFMAVFPMLWFGHALGLAVIGPFVLSLTPAKLAPFRSFSRAFETVALLVGVGVVAGLVFSSVQPITFLLVPLLILTAVRLRIVGATAALVIVAVIAVVASRLGLGPYAAT